ncbi:hypothetical protein HKCCE4037_11290 [Rhodobacterales bacterium HKCCE4037]|nr:hypothetical protein [Rhodobacterales bacterium HKCCE4037]
MFKTTLTAAALLLSTLGAHATPDLARDAGALGITAPGQAEDLGYYCEWAYVYDGWGNYVYAWQCY